MRYLILTYYTKANGQIDEAIEVSKKVRTRDIQTANVILDFKELKVVKASMGGVAVNKDFHKIVEYYYKHYENVINRLFTENGYEVVKDQPPAEAPAVEVSAEAPANA